MLDNQTAEDNRDRIRHWILYICNCTMYPSTRFKLSCIWKVSICLIVKWTARDYRRCFFCYADTILMLLHAIILSAISRIYRSWKKISSLFKTVNVQIFLYNFVFFCWNLFCAIWFCIKASESRIFLIFKYSFIDTLDLNLKYSRLWIISFVNTKSSTE